MSKSYKISPKPLLSFSYLNVPLALLLLSCELGLANDKAPSNNLLPSTTYTEQRDNCSNFEPTKQPLFGDLHVHTKYSFDSYLSGQRNDPNIAYQYAKGEPIILPGANNQQTVVAKIQRPLDFTAVTDHAEFLGQISVCTQNSRSLAYWWPHCVMTRASNLWVQLLSASWWTNLGGQQAGPTERSFACTLGDCDKGQLSFWKDIQTQAERHYDRTSNCNFTTFIGYEYTDAPEQKNMHRNVIFRNANVTKLPISVYESGRGNFPALWSQLREQCIESGLGCDVMSIPHNPNLSAGLMFRDPLNDTELENRIFFEPLVEITQHKGSSECRFDRLRGLGVGTEDELCDFEQVVADNLHMLGTVNGKIRSKKGEAVAIENFGRRNMLRNVLKDGLAIEQKTGTNPFVMGFIGSTDTHSATLGGAEENNYVGHLSRRDSEYRNVQNHFFANPGGHTVVWAEENSRDSIFNALRRKETYATSGTRPIVRFFGGAEIDQNLCHSLTMIQDAYRKGVPMGGEISLSDGQPRFFVSAQKDSGTEGSPGNDLQRLQMIKGWVDDSGNTHEKVYDIAGDPNNGASVSHQSCATQGIGYTQLCTVWKDPHFDIQENVFYYARVIENPSCRWSTLQCQAGGVNPFDKSCPTQAAAATQLSIDQGASGDVYGKCCINAAAEPFYSPTIQERAWTSPIWTQAARTIISAENSL
ncbi:MAG: DUF3604 domain-containing protein [Porticoccaceae bacterium]|nr:DUF3604 domain-containing protein [Porticoccaceae bacterium]